MSCRALFNNLIDFYLKSSELEIMYWRRFTLIHSLTEFWKTHVMNNSEHSTMIKLGPWLRQANATPKERTAPVLLPCSYVMLSNPFSTQFHTAGASCLLFILCIPVLTELMKQSTYIYLQLSLLRSCTPTTHILKKTTQNKRRIKVTVYFWCYTSIFDKWKTYRTLHHEKASRLGLSSEIRNKPCPPLWAAQLGVNLMTYWYQGTIQVQGTESRVKINVVIFDFLLFIIIYNC